MLAIDRWRKWRPSDEKLEESPGCEPPKPSESTFEGFEGSTSRELPNYSDVPSDDPTERREPFAFVPIRQDRSQAMTGEKASANREIKLVNPMTPQAAAAFLGLDEKTITRWARRGYLPAHPLGEGKRKFWRFLESELSDWLAAQTNQDGNAQTREGRAA